MGQLRPRSYGGRAGGDHVYSALRHAGHSGVVRPFPFSYVDVIEQAVVTGETVLIENLEETIDPVIDPLLGRHTIKKGR